MVDRSAPAERAVVGAGDDVATVGAEVAGRVVSMGADGVTGVGEVTVGVGSGGVEHAPSRATPAEISTDRRLRSLTPPG